MKITSILFLIGLIGFIVTTIFLVSGIMEMNALEQEIAQDFCMDYPYSPECR